MALSGEHAPGAEAGAVYSSFGTPALNATGRVAFEGSLTGTGVDNTNDSGIWSEGSGILSLVAREGDTAPGSSPAVTFKALANPAINDTGQIAFQGSPNPSGFFPFDFGIWSDRSGTLSLLMRTGNAAPDTSPGTVFSTHLRDTVSNAFGHTAIAATLTGPDVSLINNKGIWSEGGGSFHLVARSGDAAPDTGPGVVFNTFFHSNPEFDLNPALNNAGQTAFYARLAGVGVNSRNNESIWLEDAGSLDLIVRQGDPAPGTGLGVVFGSPQFLIPTFSGPMLNGAGQIAYHGFLTGSGVDSTNNTGIWSGSGGSMRLVARSGEPAPGLESEVVYQDFDFFGPVLNGVGQTAFFGNLSGPGIDSTNDFGLWSEGSGSLNLVVRTGDMAPGTEPGVLFEDFIEDYLLLNKPGQIAFIGSLTGPTVDNSNNLGLWATDPTGVLTLIARTGDAFDVNDNPLIDDPRTISSVNIFFRSGGEDGRRTSFNDAGQLAFHLTFTDGTSGVFVANTRLPGDLDGDGFVGITDLNLILANWNQNVTPGSSPAGDPSGDGFVGIEDLNEVLSNWNTGTPPILAGEQTNIPEPATVTWLALGAAATTRKRRGVFSDRRCEIQNHPAPACDPKAR